MKFCGHCGVDIEKKGTNLVIYALAFGKLLCRKCYRRITLLKAAAGEL